MAGEFNIKNVVPSPNQTKYIIKGAVVTAAEYSIYQAGVSANNAAKGGVNRDKPLYKSKLGTPVYSDITIPEFTYTIDDKSYTVPEIKLYSVLLVVNSAKNIVKTPIQGLNGTIKEYISDSDDSVTITGTITGSNGNYPYEEVNNLHRLLSAPVAFKIVSKFLQNLDIDTLVIESAEIPQEEGGYSYQKFTINCVTDFPVELNIISSTSNNNTQSIASF